MSAAVDGTTGGQIGGRLGAIVRILVSAATASALTLASLLVVAWMNEDPEDQDAQASAVDAPRTVPINTPPPPSPRTEVSAPAAVSPTPATAPPTPAVDAPSPAPPRIAGLAPTSGPGTLALGGAGTLPSMGTLPGSDLPASDGPQSETPARARRRPAPRYPAAARRLGQEGFVTLRLRVDATGRVESAVVVESDPPGVFDSAALRTARTYQFSPARRGNTAVATTVQQTIRFELQQ